LRSDRNARQTFIVAAGSYAIPGKALEHNAIIAGYNVRLLDADVAALTNALARLGAEDLVIAISLWRVYDSTMRASGHRPQPGHAHRFHHGQRGLSGGSAR
jgi:DNA-binding MurR/RpiR family transcriptional regulator